MSTIDQGFPSGTPETPVSQQLDQPERTAKPDPVAVQILEIIDGQNPNEAFKAIADLPTRVESAVQSVAPPPPETPPPPVETAPSPYLSLVKTEQTYLDEKKEKWPQLEGFYSHDDCQYPNVYKNLAEFADKAGLKKNQLPPETGLQAYTEASQQTVMNSVNAHIQTLFNSDQGTFSSEKAASVTEETKRVLKLISIAQAEGDLPKDLSTQTVLNLVTEDVWKYALQDRAARENTLGTHGVIHLIDHNIRVCDEIATQLEKNGQKVRAIDRLIMHKVMGEHDWGYAMQPVREQINNGNLAADRGHNLLAAQNLRQAAQDPNSTISKVFSQEQVNIIHEGILHHDLSDVNFKVGDDSEQARRENINSAIHVADNTHAFENKLPEILYRHPESLKYMKLMQTAAAIGDTESMDLIKTKLITSIDANEKYSPDDKIALKMAAKSINADSYKYTIGRICGNNPEFTLDQAGILTITIEESAIHQEVVGLFGQREYEQLVKFIKDITDNPNVDLNEQQIKSDKGNIIIETKRRADKAGEKTDYQQQVETLVKEPNFQQWLIGDESQLGEAVLAVRQKSLEEKLSKLPSDDPERAKSLNGIETFKQKRTELLKAYLLKL